LLTIFVENNEMQRMIDYMLPEASKLKLQDDRLKYVRYFIAFFQLMFITLQIIDL
jgi:hypothetical protein